MTDKNTIIKSIQTQGLLPLYFHKDKAVSINTLRALYRAGVRAVEYTNRGEEAFSNFQAMVSIRNSEMADLYLGIGTLKNRTDAEKYVAAGADFLISPGFVPEIAAYTKDTPMLYAPGCMIPGEIIAAENAGVGFIKLFPGNALGPEFMSSIRGVFPNLLFMPTGGVDATAESISAWFDAGVCAVGMGSKLVTNELLKNNDFEAIETNTKKILDIIAAIQRK